MDRADVPDEQNGRAFTCPREVYSRITRNCEVSKRLEVFTGMDKIRG